MSSSVMVRSTLAGASDPVDMVPETVTIASPAASTGLSTAVIFTSPVA